MSIDTYIDNTYVQIMQGPLLLPILFLTDISSQTILYCVSRAMITPCNVVASCMGRYGRVSERLSWPPSVATPKIPFNARGAARK